MTRKEDSIIELLVAVGGRLTSEDGKVKETIADAIGSTPGSVAQMLRNLRIEGRVEVDATRGSGTTEVRLAGLAFAAPSGPAPSVLAIAASEMTASAWSILWRERIPRGAVSVVAGRPGAGKSTLEAAIAAELSNEGLVGIISNLEDDPEKVVLPRLLAAGADVSRVLLVRPHLSPRLPVQMESLAALVRESGASYVILDPIAAHFHPERRVHDRSALSDLMDLARETGCAIIGMHHTTKQGRRGSAATTTSVIEAVGGPQGGLSGAARAVYIYGNDPSDEDRRALACVKMNGRDLPPALLIEHETVEVRSAEMLLEAGRLCFVGEANIDPGKVLGRGKNHYDRDAECAEWLTLYLADGDSFSRQSTEVRNDGREVGFGWQTILRAATELGIERVKISLDGDSFWSWRLPDGHPMRAAVVD